MRLSRLFLFSFLLTSSPALISAQSPGRSSGGISITPKVASGWANAVGGYFNSKTPNLSTLSVVLPAMSRLNLADPAVRKSLAPVTLQVRAYADRLAASDQRALSKEDVEKLALLNAVFLPHLTETQQGQVQSARERLPSSQRKKIDEKVGAIAKSLGGLAEIGAVDARRTQPAVLREMPKEWRLGPAAKKSANSAEKSIDSQAVERTSQVRRGPLEKIKHAFRLASFALMMPALLRGEPPVLVSDLDGTLINGQESIAAPLLKSMTEILRAGGRIAILTGNTLTAVERSALDPLKAQLGAKDAALMARVTVVTNGGGKVFAYDAGSGRYELDEAVDLHEAVGPEVLKKAKKIIREAAVKLDFEGAARELFGRGVQGEIIVEDKTRRRGRDILGQFVLVPLGHPVSNRDRSAYDQAGGRERRLGYAAYLNEEFWKAGVPLKALVSGKTSLDIGIVDKGYAIKKLAERLQTTPRRIIYGGDSMKQGENDEPAAKLSGLVINVGQNPRSRLGVMMFTEERAGPEGMGAYLKIMEYYARAAAFLRGS